MARIDPSNEADQKLAFDCWATFNEPKSDWWTCHVFRLCAKADPSNLARVTLAFDREVQMYQEWMRSNQKAFARRWGIQRALDDHRQDHTTDDERPAPTGYDRAAGLEDLDDEPL